MDNKTKAKIIVDTIRRETAHASHAYIEARARLAKAQEGSDLWEKDSRNDLSWNPYNVEAEAKTVARKREEKIAREEVLKYAIDVFLEKIPEDNS